MWELDHQEGWVPKNWCFQTVLQKTLESTLDSKESKPVNPKGNQPWARADAKLHQQFDHLTWKASSLGNTLTLGKTEGKKAATEDGMVGWHRPPNGYELSRLQKIVKDKGAWSTAVHEVAKSRTQLSEWKSTTNCKRKNTSQKDPEQSKINK